MYVIIWEYHVRADHVAEFEEVYSETGSWAKLFRESNAFLGTELLFAEGDRGRYITIDRWTSSPEYASFLVERKDEYAKLDARCNGLTEHETLLGKWETLNAE